MKQHMKALVLATALLALSTTSKADLTEGQAAVVGIAIGAALANNNVNVQVQPPVYVVRPPVVVAPQYVRQNPPQTFIYGTVPEYQNYRHRGHYGTYQQPNAVIIINR